MENQKSIKNTKITTRYKMRLRDKKMINAILTVLADKELEIVNIIQEKSLSAQDIIKYTKIPHTSFYRKIN